MIDSLDISGEEWSWLEGLGKEEVSDVINTESSKANTSAEVGGKMYSI